MIHSLRRERKTKAIVEVLAMLADAHPELVRHRPRPVLKTEEWSLPNFAPRWTAMQCAMEIKRENRRPARASLPARPRRHAPIGLFLRRACR